MQTSQKDDAILVKIIMAFKSYAQIILVFLIYTLVFKEMLL